MNSEINSTEISLNLGMSREQIKTEIHRILENVPDDMLEQVYDSLRQFADKNPDQIKLSHHLNKILTEDKGLLERLAQ